MAVSRGLGVGTSARSRVAMGVCAVVGRGRVGVSRRGVAVMGVTLPSAVGAGSGRGNSKLQPSMVKIPAHQRPNKPIFLETLISDLVYPHPNVFKVVIKFSGDIVCFCSGCAAIVTKFSRNPEPLTSATMIAVGAT